MEAIGDCKIILYEVKCIPYEDAIPEIAHMVTLEGDEGFNCHACHMERDKMHERIEDPDGHVHLVKEIGSISIGELRGVIESGGGI